MNNQSPLHKAARKGHYNTCTRLLAQGSSVHSLDQSGKTPLIHAVELNRVGVINLLLAHGANPNSAFKNESLLKSKNILNFLTPEIFVKLLDHGLIADYNSLMFFLKKTIEKNLIDLYEPLKNYGVNVSDPSGLYEQAFIIAALTNHLQFLRKIIEDTPFISKISLQKLYQQLLFKGSKYYPIIKEILIHFEDFPEDLMHRLLYIGAITNDLYLLEYALQHDVNPDHRSFEFENINIGTALHLAAEHGSIDAIHFLISFGVNPSILDLDKLTAFDVAFYQHQLTACSIMLSLNAIDIKNVSHVLFNSVQDKKSALCLNLLDMGVSIHTKDKYGRTILHYAVMNKNNHLTAELLKRNANPLLADHKGETPQSIAVQKHILEIAALFYESGFHFSQDDYKQLLAHSVLHNNLKMTEKFLSVSGLLNEPIRDDKPALLLACTKNHLKIVQLLLSKNADLSVTDHKGRHALIYSAIYGLPYIAQILISRDIDINHKDIFQQTALDYAIARFQPEIIDFLRESGAVEKKSINYAQSTHQESVEKSTSETAENLKRQFGFAHPLEIKIEIDKINRWLSSLNEHDLKVRSGIRLMTQITTTDLGSYLDKKSNVTIRELAALCWKAIHDPTRYSTLDDALERYLDGLYEAQRGRNFTPNFFDMTEMPDSTICYGGVFNKFIEKLKGIYPNAVMEYQTLETAILKFQVLIKESAEEYFLSEIKKVQETHGDLRVIDRALFICKEEEITPYWENIYPILQQKIPDYLHEFRYIFKSQEQDRDFQAIMAEAPFSKCERLNDTQKLIEIIQAEKTKAISVTSKPNHFNQSSIALSAESTAIIPDSLSPILLFNPGVRFNQPALLMIEDVKKPISNSKLSK